MKQHRAALASVVAGFLVACNGSSTHTVAPTTTTTTTSPPPAAACPPAGIPSGFTIDPARSGRIQPADYSPSGDMQAAMIFDRYQGGYRTVYTDLHPAPGADTDLVIECVALQFATPTDSSRFVSAFKALRQQAGALAQAQAPTANIGGTTLQYLETGQGFHGYGIASTNVLEMAAVLGNRFSTVSVAGPNPSPALAAALLQRLATS